MYDSCTIFTFKLHKEINEVRRKLNFKHFKTQCLSNTIWNTSGKVYSCKKCSALNRQNCSRFEFIMWNYVHYDIFFSYAFNMMINN